MAIQDRVVDLVLKVQNLLSGPSEEAADSLDNLGTTAEELNTTLENLSNQQSLVDQFKASDKATEKARKEWEKAQQQVTKLTNKIEQNGSATAYQQAQLEEARRVAARANTEYTQQQQVLDGLTQELQDAGVALDSLAAEQLRIARQSAAASNAMDNLAESTDQASEEARTLNQRLSGGVASFAKWAAAGAAAAAALGVVKLTSYTREQGALARQTLNLAETLGISTDALQEFRYAFGKVGIDADATGGILKDFSEKLGDAFENQGGEAAEVIENLGLNIDDLIKMAPDQAFLEIANSLGKLSEAGQVNALESLGNDASLLLPLLKDNAAGLENLRDKANELNQVKDLKTLQELADAEESINTIVTRLDGMRDKILTGVAPAVEDMADTFDDLLEENPGLVDELSTALTGLVTSTKDWVSYVVNNFDDVKSKFQVVIDTGQFLGNSIKGVFRAVQTGAAGALTSFSLYAAGMLSYFELLGTGLNKLGVVSDESLGALSAKASSARQSVKDLASDTYGYAKAMVQAGVDAVNSFDNTGDAAENSADKQKEAQAELSADAIAVANNIGMIAQAHKENADAAEESASEQERAGERAAAALNTTIEELQTGISDANANAIEAFDDLARSGQLTAEQLKSAMATVWSNLQSEEEKEAFLEAIRQMKADGVEGAAAIGAAFETMLFEIQDKGVQSANAVREAAGLAKKATQDIANDTKTSMDDATASVRSYSVTWQEVLERAKQAGPFVGGANANWNRYLREFRENIYAWAKEQEAAYKSAQHEAAGTLDVYQALTQGSNELRDSILSQSEAVGNASLGTSSYADTVSALNEEIDQMAELSGLSREALSELDAESLSNLRDQAAEIREEIESLSDTLTNTVANMQKELASLRGEDTKVKELEYQQEQLELQEQLNRARELGDSEATQRANEALALSKEIYQEEMAQTKAQAAADQAAAAEAAAEEKAQQALESSGNGQGGTTTGSGTSTPGTSAPTSSRAAVATRRVNLSISLGNQNVGTLTNVDEDEADQFLKSLEQSKLTSRY